MEHSNRYDGIVFTQNKKIRAHEFIEDISPVFEARNSYTIMTPEIREANYLEDGVIESGYEEISELKIFKDTANGEVEASSFLEMNFTLSDDSKTAQAINNYASYINIDGLSKTVLVESDEILTFENENITREISVVEETVKETNNGTGTTLTVAESAMVYKDPDNDPSTGKELWLTKNTTGESFIAVSNPNGTTFIF